MTNGQEPAAAHICLKDGKDTYLRVEEEEDDDDDNAISCWNRLRSSQELVLVVVTVAIALDMMLYSAVLPILPPLLEDMAIECQLTAGSKSTSNRTFIQQLDINCTQELASHDPLWFQNGSLSDNHKPLLSRPGHYPVNNTNTKESDAQTFFDSDLDNGTITVTSDSLHSEMDNCAFGLTIEQQVGLVTAAKPAAELFSNVIAGSLVDKYDHRVVMVAGFFTNSAVTVTFAFTRSFSVLLSARIGQAVTSSMTLVAGLALIAATFPKGKERSNAMTLVYAGISIGPLVGYPFGTLYEVAGQQAPFLIIAGLSLVDGMLRVMIKSHKKEKTDDMGKETGTIGTFINSLRDPYLVAIYFGSFICDTTLGIVTSSSTVWVMETLNAAQWQVGVILTITQMAQLISLKIGATFGQFYGQWKIFFIGFWVIAISLISYPFSTTIWETVAPHCLFRIGVGLMMSVTSSMLCDIADLRHQSRYGPVLGLYSAFFNLGLTVGALLGGYVQFDVLYRSAAVACMLTSFCAIVVRKPLAQNGKENAT